MRGGGGCSPFQCRAFNSARSFRSALMGGASDSTARAAPARHEAEADTGVPEKTVEERVKMGQKKKRRLEFFRKHPFCCFCGGHEQATEEDHVPARAIFDERKWPEGYNFPACVSCNRLTREDEKVAAFLSRIHFGNDLNPTQQSELKKCMDAINSAYPEAYRSMVPSSNQARHFLKQTGIERPSGTSLRDLPC